MKIGIDFDNTMVCYDELFHKVALEQNVIPGSVAVNKIAVRDYLRSIGREEIWTEMQGYVYGARMDEAKMFDGVLDFIILAKKQEHEVIVVSHKTRHPFLGHQYDLHTSAKKWLKNHIVFNGMPLFEDGQFFFEETKENKLNRIGSCGCDVFIDDLPEILNNKLFPEKTKKILFSPGFDNNEQYRMQVERTWLDIRNKLL